MRKVFFLVLCLTETGEFIAKSDAFPRLSFSVPNPLVKDMVFSWADGPHLPSSSTGPHSVAKKPYLKFTVLLFPQVLEVHSKSGCLHYLLEFLCHVQDFQLHQVGGGKGKININAPSCVGQNIPSKFCICIK